MEEWKGKPEIEVSCAGALGMRASETRTVTHGTLMQDLTARMRLGAKGGNKETRSHRRWPCDLAGGSQGWLGCGGLHNDSWTRSPTRAEEMPASRTRREWRVRPSRD